MPQNIKLPQNEAANHIKSGKLAVQQGQFGQALAHFIQATKKAPHNHRYKIHLCEFLKNINFPNHEVSIQKIILELLQTEKLDHKCLYQPWLSLILKDPEMTAFQNLIEGEDYNMTELEKSLNNPFFLEGIQKFICLNINFERAMKTIKALIDDQEIKSKKFSDAFDIYNDRTEKLLSDTKEFTLDYEIDSSIPSLSKIDHQTSKDVQNQYEHSPYPRWTSYHLMPPPQETKESYDHLIAGCGTGYSACMTAMLFPHANITAFDLSRASLTHAKQKAQEIGFDNIDFYQADILDLDALDKKFDVIECSGVLHHMKDPIEGWHSLIQKLKPDGKMHIGLYSEMGRADIIAARDFIAENNFKTTPPGIRDARNAIADLPPEHPARGVLNRHDFYSLSGCRDLIFHVQEHRFTLQQIKQALSELGLVFDHFSIDDPTMRQLYKQKYPQDTTMNNLDHWHDLEQANPALFRGMYQFWCHLA